MNRKSLEPRVLNLIDGSGTTRALFAVPGELVFGAWLVVACFVTAFAAAHLMQVDKIVAASGVLETPLGVHEVRNMVSGHVRHIHVQVGQSVNQGDELVEFEANRTRLEIMRAQSDMDSSARVAWSLALTILPQLGPSDRVELEGQLAQVPQPSVDADHAQRLGAQVERLVQVFEADAHGMRSRLQDLEKQRRLKVDALTMQQQEVERSKSLVDSGFESPNSLLSRQRALVEARTQEAGLQADIKMLRGQLARLAADQARQLDSLVIDSMQRLNEHLANFHRARVERSLLQDQLEHLVIRAPFDGVVDALHLRGPSEYLPENSPLLQLRPATDEVDLVLNITVPAQQAVWVKAGMRFRATPEGHSADEHGSLKGSLSFVSQSSHETEQGLSFRAKGQITLISLKQTTDRQTLLRPGSQLRVEIVAGKRRLLSYLLDPIQKTLREAAREPG